ncbi:MAG TPA: hypothetical protein VKV39_20260 [Candidatus Sulfotelmatobacter sp.]|nr:hypothetical protein [Candidatus Sulfotelmatobacter sp.]
MSESKHPGISMHKLPIGGGFIGLVFTAGCSLIFLFGLPALWYFVALSAILGIGLGLVFRFVNRRGSSKPLSILADSQLPAPQRQPGTNSRGDFSRMLPATHTL